MAETASGSCSGRDIMDEQGNLRVTRLGSEIVMSHMDSSSAIDLMRTPSIYNVTTANPLQLPTCSEG